MSVSLETMMQFRCNPPDDFRPLCREDGDRIIGEVDLEGHGKFALGYKKSDDPEESNLLDVALRTALWQACECVRLGIEDGPHALQK